MSNSNNLLEIRDLVVKFKTEEGIVNAVNGVNYSVPEGCSIGVVGESGCGKTVSAYSITRLLPKNATFSGQILYKERNGKVTDTLALPAEGKEIRRLRGRDISMIFQEPMSSLSPVHTINNQLSEAMILFQNMSKQEARERSIELLDLVGIPNPSRRVDEYPFQFSGGMRQRVMIAMALARNPRLLIADEPTTALDVTLQAQVLKLIQSMQNEFNLSMILITHDLGVVAHMVDYIYIMYLGRVVERGKVVDIFDNPLHPYTKGLLNSIPKLKGKRGERVSSIPGTVPSTYVVPVGCGFAARCPYAKEQCFKELPDRVLVEDEHEVSCFLFNGGEVKEDAANA